GTCSNKGSNNLARNTVASATRSGESSRQTLPSGTCVVARLEVSFSEAKHITLVAARSRACNHSVCPRNLRALGKPQLAIASLLTGPVTNAVFGVAFTKS